MTRSALHGEIEGTGIRLNCRSSLPRSADPLPEGHGGSLGPPGPPNNRWFVAGTGSLGLPGPAGTTLPTPRLAWGGSSTGNTEQTYWKCE